MNANLLLRVLFFILFSLSSAAKAADELPQTDAARYVALTQEIRCVVCQNQNLAESTAPIADDLRQKIYTMILEKKSDTEIKDYLVKRYGEFILLKPRFNLINLFLWLFPIVGVFGVLFYFFRAKPVTA